MEPVQESFQRLTFVVARVFKPSGSTAIVSVVVIIIIIMIMIYHRVYLEQDMAEDGGSMFFQNVGTYLHGHTALQPRRPTSKFHL
jgi:hypothetical protein